MSKFLKITLIILTILLISININFVQATEEQLESDVAPISEDLESASDVQETDAAKDAASQVTSALETLSTSSVTRVSTVNSYDQANLQLNNILSIILISIGVLLILFAIAILIRLKK